MAGLLPPVIATLIADTKEYMVKMKEAQAQMEGFGASATASGGKLNNFANKASTAIIGLGAAIIGYGVDSALKFTESLDQIQNQSNASAAEIEYLKTAIINVSNETAISSENIAGAFLVVEKAGITGANAYNLVDAAAKAAAITGGDVATITKTIVAAQTLQIAKGMNVAAISDLMVRANKAHIGSLDSLVEVLSGKVGSQLAAYGVSMAEAASISDVASKAGITTSRAFTTLSTGLGTIENPTKASTKALAAFHISAVQLAQTAKTPGTGVIDVIKELDSVSKTTGISFSDLITKTFGKGSVGIATVLRNQITQVSSLNKTLAGSSASDLNTTFGLTSSQLNFKLTQLKNEAKNVLTGIGLFFLPAVADLANWSSNTMKYFQDHPLMKTIASDSAIALFVGAIAFKLGSAINSTIQTITGTTSAAISSTQNDVQISLLTEIATATAETAAALTASDILGSGANIAQIAGTAGELVPGAVAASTFLPALVELAAIAAAIGALWWAFHLTQEKMTAIQLVDPKTNERGGTQLTRTQRQLVDSSTPYGNITPAQAYAAADYVKNTLHDTYSTDKNSKYYKDIMVQFQQFAKSDVGKKSSTNIKITVKAN